MTDSLPATGLQAGVITIINNDATAIYTITRAPGAIFDVGTIFLGPGQRASIWSNGNGAYYALNVPSRVRFGAPTSVYVTSTAPNDADFGFSVSHPWQTLTHCWNWLYNNADLAGFSVNAVCNGNFGGLDAQGSLLGGGGIPVTFDFVSGSTIHGSGQDIAMFGAYGAGFTVKGEFPNGVTITSDNWDGIRSATTAQISMDGIITFGNCGNSHMFAGLDGRLATGQGPGAPIYISGNVPVCIYANGGIFDGGATMTVAGGLHFQHAFAVASSGGQLLSFLQITAGGVTGQRYVCDTGGVISSVNGGDPNFFPGDTPGTPDPGVTEDAAVYSTN